MIRLIHFSDIHITAQVLGWTPRDWVNKRLAAWMNFRWLGRGRRFRRADDVLARMVEDAFQRTPDRLIFSGDATALGFESELRRAAEALRVGQDGSPTGLAVPGNHDYCTREAAASGLFERYFAPWQTGVRLDGEVYPFAQRVGHVNLVAVNSCTGNRWAWDAGGSVGAGQLLRLRQLLAKLESGPRILVTHYPICLASGRLEHRVHGLRDMGDLVQVASEGGVSLWLHGHRHHTFHFQTTPFAPFPVVCAGSTTQTGYWTYAEYSIEGLDCRVQRRAFNPTLNGFRDAETFHLQLR